MKLPYELTKGMVASTLVIGALIGFIGGLLVTGSILGPLFAGAVLPIALLGKRTAYHRLKRERTRHDYVDLHDR